ncbi:hypothetical protein AQUSIP_12960 [Aquicella siphonis]|uniref:Uncharacterized protein n=1 Tax=Aquicella siphonis TaxID=254247 RepID=A0A5E4PHC4_9COXI|nr:hypothetical protein [Aquicella siphonis]VVC75995.1 hypothetical protein AQUSIP_12960 [Aquicella siphonis]
MATINAINSPILNCISSGRLTLTSNTPVTTSDVTGATTVYYTPYIGCVESVYNGTVWELLTFTQLSISVPSTTNTNYDVFVYNNGGVLTAASPVAWTNDTTRATALAYQDGVLVKSGDATRKFIGSFRTGSVSGQVADSKSFRHVSNYYNRISRPLLVTDSTSSWTYTSSSFRQARANSANQLDVLICYAEDEIYISVQGLWQGSSTGASGNLGIGINSTSTNSSSLNSNMQTAVGNVARYMSLAIYNDIPPTGRTTFVWLESGANSVTFYGNQNSGIHGIVRN